MKKHFRLVMLALVILILSCMTAVHAEIIPPEGEGQIGFQAVVLCETLTLREKPSASSKALKRLQFGDRVNVLETEAIKQQSNGWAYVVLGDAEDSPAGWVNPDYLAVDPAWYRTEGSTPVYAWNDAAAPKVALLDGGTILPILKEEGKWLLVSLRGAVGWIYNP